MVSQPWLLDLCASSRGARGLAALDAKTPSFNVKLSSFSECGYILLWITEGAEWIFSVYRGMILAIHSGISPHCMTQMTHSGTSLHSSTLGIQIIRFHQTNHSSRLQESRQTIAVEGGILTVRMASVAPLCLPALTAAHGLCSVALSMTCATTIMTVIQLRGSGRCAVPQHVVTVILMWWRASSVFSHQAVDQQG
jgi:hypothetical protein